MPDTRSLESRRRQINEAQAHDAVTVMTNKAFYYNLQVMFKSLFFLVPTFPIKKKI